MLQVGGLALLLIGSLVALGTWASDVPAAPPGMVNEVLSFREGAMPYLWGMPNAHGANSQYIQRGAFQRTPKKHKELPPNPVPPPPPSVRLTVSIHTLPLTPTPYSMLFLSSPHILLQWFNFCIDFYLFATSIVHRPSPNVCRLRLQILFPGHPGCAVYI